MSTSDVITPRLVAKNPPLTHKPRTRRKAASARSPLIRLDVWSAGDLTPMLVNPTEIRRVVESGFEGTTTVYLDHGPHLFVTNSLDEIEKMVAGQRA